MNRANTILTQVMTSAAVLMLAFPAFAGGGGGGGGGGGPGTGAPEPSFLAMCAIVAGTELGRRVLKSRRKNI